MTNQKRNSRHLAKLPRGEGAYQQLLWERYPISEDNLTTQQVKKRFHLRDSVIQQARTKRFLELDSAVLLYKGWNHWRIIGT
jgi:hypothetical protein